jgi:hypothetical protein
MFFSSPRLLLVIFPVFRSHQEHLEKEHRTATANHATAVVVVVVVVVTSADGSAAAAARATSSISCFRRKCEVMICHRSFRVVFLIITRQRRVVV